MIDVVDNAARRVMRRGGLGRLVAAAPDEANAALSVGA